MLAAYRNVAVLAEKEQITLREAAYRIAIEACGGERGAGAGCNDPQAAYAGGHLRRADGDRLPWAAALDLWFRANQRAGTLPARLPRAASLRGLRP